MLATVLSSWTEMLAAVATILARSSETVIAYNIGYERVRDV